MTPSLNELILYTSGSTKEPKEISHGKASIELMVRRSINELELTEHDTVLNVLPSNVIGYYSVLSLPAITQGSKFITSNFEPYQYIRMFNKHQPTVTVLIPRHIEILQNTKGWDSLDMSCVRYLVMGTAIIPQETIDILLAKGVKKVGNWYGMTEMPPPVIIGHNTESFDFTPTEGYTVTFTDEGECVINGLYTGDIFDLETKKFIRRKNVAHNNTWKTQPST
jgi:acyl-coenzyme A synthetase/AMP-(fatty) acid ligase